MITKERAIEIANEHASQYYRDLSIYKINSLLIKDKWKIDYELRDEKLDGGGPHYVISAKNGTIIEYKFYQ